MDPETQFGNGFAFYKGAGKSDRLLPFHGEDHREWIKGFCMAMADYDLEQEDPTIQAALLNLGIDGDLLEDLLQAAESIADSDEWCRWPSVPVRGWGETKAAIKRLRADLPRIFVAANDEVD
jgi:hypothetical protein